MIGMYTLMCLDGPRASLIQEGFKMRETAAIGFFGAKARWLTIAEPSVAFCAIRALAAWKGSFGAFVCRDAQSFVSCLVSTMKPRPIYMLIRLVVTSGFAIDPDAPKIGMSQAEVP